MQGHPASGLFRADERGQHVFVDRRWCEIAGLSAEQAIGEGWVQAVSPEERERVLDAWREAVVASVRFQCEYHLERNGALVLSQAEIARGSDGKNAGFIGSLSDVRALRHRQVELEHSVEQLTATLDSMRDGILVLDRFGEQQTRNAKLSELWGFSRAQTINSELLHARILERLKNPHDFLPRIAELKRLPDSESEDILELNDGRTLLLYSRPQRVRGHNAGRVWSFRDITEFKETESRLTDRAYHDALTGLPNRYLLADRMTQALAQASRDKKKLALLFVDLDHFKKINDRLGHFAADRMLKETAARIVKCVREVDTVARIGGDEFVVLLPVVSQARDAGEVAGKILATLQMPFDDEARVSASIGISVLENGDETAELLLQRADFAMYYAKQCGRNRYRYYNTKMSAAA
jgi:diguanylate cyclase (GGDEF)-like protein/PAS domain S-box-containing protein